jgi:hypothetical protein
VCSGRHKLADGLQQTRDRSVVRGELAFELVHLCCQLSMTRYDSAQPYEGANYQQAHGNGTRRSKNVAEHERTVLRKGVRQILSVTATATL